MEKIVIFAFKGDPMCFIHVLLNALNMKASGIECKIVVEGEATKLVPDLFSSAHPLNSFFMDALSKDLIAGVCKACATKMGTIDAVRALGLALLDDMKGHPGMANYIKNGFSIITM